MQAPPRPVALRVFSMHEQHGLVNCTVMAPPSSEQVGRVMAAMVGLLGGASVGFWMQVLLPRTWHGALCSCTARSE
jgi:hypothetical protein